MHSSRKINEPYFIPVLEMQIPQFPFVVHLQSAVSKHWRKHVDSQGEIASIFSVRACFPMRHR